LNPVFFDFTISKYLSAVKKTIIRNTEPTNSRLKANRIVSGVAPQAGAGEGSTSSAIHDW